MEEMKNSEISAEISPISLQNTSDRHWLLWDEGGLEMPRKAAL